MDDDRRDVVYWMIWLAVCFAFGFGLGRLPRASGQEPKVELGRRLFHDRIMSGSGDFRCADCHQADKSFADNLQIATGNGGRLGIRNSQSLFGAAFKRFQFHDGRTEGVNEQAVQPQGNIDEMGLEPGGTVQDINDVVDRLNQDQSYLTAFSRVYGGQNATPELVGDAIAAFVSKIVPTGLPVWRRQAGDRTALSPPAEKGYQVMVRVGCFRCHSGRFFRDGKVHNNGMRYRLGDYDGDFGARVRIVTAGGGRRRVVDEESAAFMTPTLVGIARSQPYGHSGLFPRLSEIVDHYSNGGARKSDGKRDPKIDGRVAVIRITGREKPLVEAFLVEALVPDGVEANR